jgi:hypothetical protein
LINEEDRKKRRHEECQRNKDLVTSIVIFTASGDAIYNTAAIGKSKREKDSKSKGFWKWIKKNAVGILTLIALIVYTIYTAKQWKANKKAADAAKSAADAAQNTADITRDSLLYVQRAFIFVNDFDVTRLVAPGTSRLDGSMRFAFHWENGGTTPTLDMQTHISFELLRSDLPEDFTFPDLPKGEPPFRMFVGPKATSRSAPLFVPAPDIIAVHDHMGRLYIWGWAKYRDIFPKTGEHITRFCSELTDVTGDLSGVNGTPVNLQTANCPRGNCYDQECKEQ